MRKIAAILVLFAAAWVGAPAHGVTIATVTRLQGQRPNVIVGMGLVFGLKGTGDGGDFAPAIKPLAEMLKNFNDMVPVQQLGNVQNVAIVYVEAVIPAKGAYKGSAVDVHVSSIGAASSLRGGRLFPTPLLIPNPDLRSFTIALARGPIELEDESSPVTGVIKGGAILEQDMPTFVIEHDSIALIIDEPVASWTTASTIAKIINDAEGNGTMLAVAEDPTRVSVTIPANEREHPDSFIARVQQLPVRLLPTEAQVRINERKGSIIITGDVEISPTVICHKGLVISTITPPPIPTQRNPVTTEKHAIALDTTSQGGPKLKDLVDALDMIRVPVADRITIVQELYKTGKLHAKLITE